jgi:NADH-quinone oxidoreductase subunit L
MTIPLVVLAVLSVAGGLVGIPMSLGGSNAIEQWLEPVFTRANAQLLLAREGVLPVEYLLIALSVAIAVAGIYGARMIYLRKPVIAEKASIALPHLYHLFWNKYYVDELYDAAIVRPTVRISESVLWKGFDVRVIDGTVNGTAKLVAWASSHLRKIQGGVAQGYALAFVVGIIVVLGLLIFK